MSRLTELMRLGLIGPHGEARMPNTESLAYALASRWGYPGWSPLWSRRRFNVFELDGGRFAIHTIAAGGL